MNRICSRRKPAKRKPRQDKVGNWLCTRCRHHKPACEFSIRKDRGEAKPHSWCKQCFVIDVTERRNSPEGKAYMAEYYARPSTRRRHREYEKNRQVDVEARREKQRRYQATPKGKLVHQQSNLKWNIARATDPRRKATMERRLAAIRAELARIDRARHPPELRAFDRAVDAEPCYRPQSR